MVSGRQPSTGLRRGVTRFQPSGQSPDGTVVGATMVSGRQSNAGLRGGVTGRQPSGQIGPDGASGDKEWLIVHPVASRIRAAPASSGDQTFLFALIGSPFVGVCERPLINQAAPASTHYWSRERTGRSNSLTLEAENRPLARVRTGEARPRLFLLAKLCQRLHVPLKVQHDIRDPQHTFCGLELH
jgi:hypothetical protein